MAVTVARFVNDFPEFRDTDEAQITAKLTQAARRINVPVWGTAADDGVMFLAAHLLSISPAGEGARIQTEKREDVYLLEWNRMKREVAYGFRTT